MATIKILLPAHECQISSNFRVNVVPLVDFFEHIENRTQFPKVAAEMPRTSTEMVDNKIETFSTYRERERRADSYNESLHDQAVVVCAGRPPVATDLDVVQRSTDWTRSEVLGDV